MKKMTLNDIKNMCIKVDIENIGNNGFRYKKDVDTYWRNLPASNVIKIFDEYYGLEEALRGDYNTADKVFDYDSLKQEVNDASIGTNKSIKTPKYIQDKMHRLARLQFECSELSKELEEWFREKGVTIGTEHGQLRCGDGRGLDELDYGNDVTDEIVRRLSAGEY